MRTVLANMLFAGLLLGCFAVAIWPMVAVDSWSLPQDPLWRYPKDYPGVEVNYDDNGLTCGGLPRYMNNEITAEPYIIISLALIEQKSMWRM